jgi:hypothetical protein
LELLIFVVENGGAGRSRQNYLTREVGHVGVKVGKEMTDVIGGWVLHGTETTSGFHLLVFGKTGEDG